jgi:hypothetical protein
MDRNDVQLMGVAVQIAFIEAEAEILRQHAKRLDEIRDDIAQLQRDIDASLARAR